MNGGWLVNTGIAMAFLAMGVVFVKWFLARNESPVLESIGEVKGLDVDIVMHEDGDLVGLAFHGDDRYVRVLLSAHQARLLAEWLRIAASKGKTVMQARVNYRRTRTP